MASPAITKKTNPPAQIESALDKALRSFGERIYDRDSKNRFAEDREYYQQALFYQMKQWLTLQDNRWKPIQQDTKKPVPMPVSDYYSKTINANANSLGANIPEISANADDTDTVNRRAAEAAESALLELDNETGMDILNPVLAKHTALWGMGCVKDTVDTSESTGVTEIPGIDLNTSTVKTCQQCGYTDNGPVPQMASAGMPPSPPSTQDENCPTCGTEMDSEDSIEPQAGDVQAFPTGKITSELVTMFEVYLPRDCRDPNLSPIVTQRYRKSKNKAKNLFPNAGEFPADDKRDIPQFYIDSLRSLVMSGTESAELVTFTEIWCDWAEIDEETQDAIETEWGNEPSQVIGYQGKTRLQAAKQYGIYFIYVTSKILAKSENPWDGKKCYTFFPWEKDPASPYPIGLGARIVPLQKQLNRTDSLMELSEMTNAVGKWIIPLTQQGVTKINGSPHDHIWWDNQGDGKTPPTFVQPNPYSAALVQKRMQIVADFEKLGYTEGVGAGEAPNGVKSFRGIAYLGAKQEENIATQRFLWEQSHKLRKEKLLIMATKVWDEPRKAKVAGFNGKMGMKELTGKDLQGNYGISAVKDSSRPKTANEKMQALQGGAQAGLIDMTDPQTRDFAMTTFNLTELNQADHYNYSKFDRDLEVLKTGNVPFEVPSQKWDIWIKGLGNYQLTEEFEELDPAIQHGILFYFQYCSDKLAAVTQGTPPDPLLATKQMAAAAGGKGGDPLSGIPGQTEAPAAAEGAAQKQGQGFAQAMSPSIGAA